MSPPRKRRRWPYLVTLALMLAALPFLWLVARDALHLAFADEEETQRLVYNVLIPGVYSALDRNERLRPSKPSGETVISLNFEPIADTLPPCFDLLRVEIAPRYATDPPIDVAKDWAEHSLRRPWGISNADMTDYEENVALSFSPLALSAYRACIEATPFGKACARRFRTNIADRGASLNEHRVRLYGAARILDANGKPTGQYCQLSAVKAASR